jgi:tetratricopeptide (TPR) repeat protein
MTSPDETRRVRTGIFLIILIALIALYPLSLRLISQLYVHFAHDQMESKNYAAAASRLEKALTVYASDFDAWKDLGYVYYHMSESSSPDAARGLMIEAKEAFMTALQLNPIDAQSAYGLARVEARLEQMYGFVDSAPFDAGPYFEDAIRLRPNSILYHSALARYLHRKNDRQALLEAVENLAFVFPRAYGYLKKEKYWAPDAREAVKRGLERSIAGGNSLQDAHTIMSSLMAEEKNLPAAVEHYEKFLAQPGAGNNPASELRLAELYLKQGKTEAAEEIFWRALAPAASREQALKRIAGIYRKNQLLDAFDAFYLKVSRDFLPSPPMDILHARILAELERYDEAESVLGQLNRKEPTAEAYYELYRIAARKKDRNAMILAISQAAIHDRSNARYHQLFAGLLVQEKDLEKAEREAGLAIRYSPKPSPGLYALRADIRWKRKNYTGTAEDYASAAELQPTKAHIHARTAAAYEKAGDRRRAGEFYARAAEIDPDNPTYRDRLNALGTAVSK